MPTPGWWIHGQAASAIVDAITDTDGPMRYGCDPVSLELLDLWRQSDDETVFAMTGQSLLDQSQFGAIWSPLAGRRRTRHSAFEADRRMSCSSP